MGITNIEINAIKDNKHADIENKNEKISLTYETKRIRTYKTGLAPLKAIPKTFCLL